MSDFATERRTLFIKDSAMRLVTFFLILFFGLVLFLTVKYFKDQVTLATSPSAESQKTVTKFDKKVLDKVIERLNQ